MTDITPMPNNASSYYRKALNELSNNNYPLAIDYLEKSFNLDKELDSFEELVKIYIQRNMNDKLKQLWQDAEFTEEEISNSSLLTILYAQSLQQFEFSEEILLKLYQLRDKTQSAKAVEAINSAIQTIDNSIILMKRIRHNQDASFTQDIIKLSPLDLLGQLKLIYKLPLKETQSILMDLLMTKNVLNYIKSDILHYFIYQEVQDEIQFTWFNENKQARISDLEAYNQTHFYKQAVAFLRQAQEKENPHLTDEFIQLFTLHSMVCYPYLEETLISGEDWLASLENPDQSEIGYYINLANEELNQIFY